MPQLTPEQEAQIPYYSKKWRDIAYSTDPIDREKVTEIINRAYSLIGKQAPPIIFCGSPFDYIQKVSELVKDRQPPDPSRYMDMVKQSFSRFQGLGELYQQAQELSKEVDLTQTSESLNPKMQSLVDETLKQNFPWIFNLDDLELNVEQLEKERKADSQKFKEEQKQEFPEFQAPADLGEGLNRALNCHNEVQEEIIKQIGHDLRSDILNLLGNESKFGSLKHLIDDAVKPYSEKLIPQLVYNSISNISSASSYNWFDFSISVLGCDCDREWWESSVDILQNCGSVYPFENLCYVCDRPTKILLDEDELAHALGETAIEYPDGFKIYAYRGTLLTEKYTSIPPSQWQAKWYKEESENHIRQALIEVLPSEQLQVTWLLEEENITLRQLLMEKIGYERISSELNIDDDLNILSQALEDTSGSSLWVARAILENRTEPKIQQVIQKWRALESDFSKLRKMLLIDSLERILDWYKLNAPNYVKGFQQGLTYEEIEEKVKYLPFTLPQEFYDLYQWSNGNSNETGIFTYLYHSSLEQALEISDYTNDSENIKMRIEDNYPVYLFPIFDFDGEYFAVQGTENEAETSLIYHIAADGGGESLIFNSLTTMMMAIAESYEKGVYIYNPEYNSVDWEDLKKSGEIRLKYNIGTAQRIYGEGG
jgi:hypothetical protein